MRADRSLPEKQAGPRIALKPRSRIIIVRVGVEIQHQVRRLRVLDQQIPGGSGERVVGQAGAEVVAEEAVGTGHGVRVPALPGRVRQGVLLVDARVAATNQLAALLDAHWPGAKAIFANIESAIALAFLTAYPTAVSAAGLTEKRLAMFCTQQGYSGKKPAFNHPDAIAALAGITPVTKASGKQRGVSFRWACNKRPRQAVTTFAANSRFASPWAADIYDRARASGKDHPHATRILARAWVRVMWRCWQNGTPYDPALHGGAQQTTEQQLAA